MVSFYGTPRSGTHQVRADPVSIAGDKSAFHDFYKMEADGVYRALALALGDSDLAKEATHEGMIRAYQRWQRVGLYDNPAGWVYRVSLNWARSRLRTRKREVLTREVEATDRFGSLLAGETEVDERVGDALAQLSIDHRSVVVLRYLLDWSTAETAAALGVAKGTVKSRLARALAEMEETLRATP